MFSDLLRRLQSPRPAPLPELDGRLALGALLVRMAKVDHHYAVEQIRRIDRILAARFDLNPVEAAKMRADCERLEADAPDGERFAEMVRASMPLEERRGLLTAMWQVALADGVHRSEEDAMLERNASRLGLGHEDVEAARPQTD
ncbi:TerB family tellurite resistance protein [Tropicimonas sp. IMCC34011]|uniref:tellurite resistance TerB family protein n=1 Tax=Tropicimonas sp. IMCC34011 TaxID=2248759 RepID=UPI000E2349B0|nr:TerB family tellurite resistance protein [Tropicimonas sp. IMCC34011]